MIPIKPQPPQNRILCDKCDQPVINGKPTCWCRCFYVSLICGACIGLVAEIIAILLVK